jgi:hypothetical protein
MYDEINRINEKNKSILIVGNPPWISVSDFSTLGVNLDLKRDKAFSSGIEAKLGTSNFDLAEHIIIFLIRKFIQKNQLSLGMIVKDHTAFKIYDYLQKNGMYFNCFNCHKIEANKHFGVNVASSFLIIKFGGDSFSNIKVFESIHHNQSSKDLKIINGKTYPISINYDKLSYLDGKSDYIWRQGVKHDLTSVVELKPGDGNYFLNKDNEIVNVENEVVYPFMKCTDVYKGEYKNRKIIITNKSLNEDTNHIKYKFPNLWAYLYNKRYLFDARKSSIYINTFPFSYFGIGQYTFLPYKVAISGFHKTPKFMLIKPIDDKPVILDDTTYFIGFENFDEANYVYNFLTTNEVLDFLDLIKIRDAKRPFTKKLLSRIAIPQQQEIQLLSLF